MKLTIGILIILLLAGLLWLASCKSKNQEATAGTEVPVEEVLPTLQPAWAKNAVIYEVNIRQYTPEGTFNAFSTHLDRLADMGIDIIWLMPINPISVTKRKGTLGSYYAVSDYLKINPEFGTRADFDAMVEKIHSLGMKVILDWVPNHTGWDHTWIKEHPEYYKHDKDGNIIDPINHETGEPWGWTDVAELDFSNKEMRKAMINDMIYWLKVGNVDGFRMDHPHGVDDDFWAEAGPALREIKDVYLLAESDLPYHTNSGIFASDYGLSFYELLVDLAEGEKGPSDIDKWLENDQKTFKRGYHMNFVTNHDKNSWEGTEIERMGDAVDAMTVLAFTFDGMPLVYSGQESAYNKRIEFFEKDPIQWGDYSKTDFLKTLIDLKHRNQALWNGEHGGEPTRIQTTKDEQVYAFMREKNGDKVIVLLNLKNEPVEVSFVGDQQIGTYNNVLESGTINLAASSSFQLGPWGTVILSNK